MLKKLAKYGNSTTLVIDKAILELLNMNESSVVKLHTDGKSLIITPVDPSEQDQKVSYEAYEAFSVAKNAIWEKNGPYKGPQPNDAAKEEMKQAFRNVFQKHAKAFERFGHISASVEFQQALAAISTTIDPKTQPDAYMQEVEKVKVQLCPELKEFNTEMQALAKKYNS